MIHALIKEHNTISKAAIIKPICKKAAWLILLYTGIYMVGSIYYLLNNHSALLLINIVLLPLTCFFIWNEKHLIKSVFLLSALSVIIFIVNYIYNEHDYYKSLVTAIFLIITGIYNFFLKVTFTSIFYKYWFSISKFFQILLGITIIGNSYEEHLDLSLSMDIVFFMFGLLFFLISYSIFIIFLLIQEQTNILEKDSQNNRNKDLTEEEKFQLLQLNKFFNESDQYTQIQFCFDHLSDHLDIPKNELSHLIHKVYGMNFYKFIAFMRISFAIEKLKELNDQTTIENVMLESGFSSKPTFYKYFKELTGGTPSDYLKKIQ